MKESSGDVQTWRVLAMAVAGAAAALIAWRWYHYYIYTFGLEGHSLPEVLYKAPRACRPYLEEDAVSLNAGRDADGDLLLTVGEWSAR